ncbi:N,N'-diacetyllegionaminic acid synthase [mine drainage metagenome]|uniref:N,N'-diacetyllegionaminic acid synthase n=1 Tax=mine drainage metagenome TaxID=410659 RepID=A0A1J5PM67_9ZZZZ
MQIELNNKKIISENHEPYFIAEMNTSHFGDVAKAKKMVDMVKECGGDCVKFQSWSEDTLYSNEYYKENPIAKRFVKKLSLNEQQLKELSEYARDIGIDFASTPYSTQEVDFLLNECRVPFIKVASMDINNYPYLRYLAKTQSAIILSTGMADIEEIEKAVEVLESAGAKNICLLHCVSIYPVDPEFVNLNNIKLLKTAFTRQPIGYSDHTLGIEVGTASVARGACVIEKHVTLDKTIIGMDNQMAIERDELRQMVSSIKKVFKSLGNSQRVVSNDELVQRKKMRRSLIANTDLQAGDILTENNLGAKRPGTGISVSDWDSYLGKKVNKKVDKDSLLSPHDLD